MSKKEKKARQRQLRKAAKSLLTSRYGVSPRVLHGFHSIQKSILHYQPTIESKNGYACLAEFVGSSFVAPLVARKERWKSSVDPNSDAFLVSYEWRRTRMEVLKRDGARCACCGGSPLEGRVMNVDHIKPRKTHPHLALDPSNLQVLCDVCNHGKGNWDKTDWRKPTAMKIAEIEGDPLIAEFRQRFGADLIGFSMKTKA